MSKVPAKVTARISKNYNRMKKIVLNAIERDINEADTVLIVSEILANIYGYDKFKEITREYAVRSTFVDLDSEQCSQAGSDRKRRSRNGLRKLQEAEAKGSLQEDPTKNG